jgi:hypothetical protein
MFCFRQDNNSPDIAVVLRAFLGGALLLQQANSLFDPPHILALADKAHRVQQPRLLTKQYEGTDEKKNKLDCSYSLDDGADAERYMLKSSQLIFAVAGPRSL